MPNSYSVYVGNVGCVYDGSDKKEAEEEFYAYRARSRKSKSRCTGETVTLFENDEPIEEYEGTNTEEGNE